MEKKKQDVKKKAIKTERVNKVKFETAEQQELKKFLVVILVVVLCVGGIYLFTRAFITKDLFKKDEPREEVVTPGEVDYEKAVMGTIFNGEYDDYYVAIYNTVEGDYVSDMYILVYDYTEKENHKHMYTVDLSNEVFNGSYYDPENVNTNAKTLEELKVGDATLLRIQKNKKTGKKEITKYITDIDAMKKELGLNK